MKRKHTFLIGCLVAVISLFAMGQRSRYAPVFWRAISGGIEYVTGNVTMTSGNLTLTSGNTTLTSGDVTLTSGNIKSSTDVSYMLKTVIKTFDVNAADTTDDYQFDNTAGDANEQPVEIPSIIPAYAEIVSLCWQ